MKNIHKCFKLLVLSILLLSLKTVSAGHLLGGEINYVCTGGNTYQVELILYHEPGALSPIGSGNNEDESILMVFKNDSISQQTYTDGVRTIPMTSQELVVTRLDDTCLIQDQSKNYYETKFVGSIDLEPYSAGYTIAYFRCCREADNFVNIEVDNQGLAFSATIPGTDDFADVCNSTPKFDEQFPRFVCSSKFFSMDMSATDPDGDSLVYQLVAPRAEGGEFQTSYGSDVDLTIRPPFTTDLLYSSGFGGANPFGNNDISINTSTGIVSGRADSVLGEYILGVQVSEYRDGELIGTKIRDFAVVVDPCIGYVQPNPIDPNANAKGINCGLKVNFDNTGSGGTEFAWDFGDVNTGADISTEESPTWTYDNPGTYTVTLTANDGDCDSTVSFEVAVSEADISADFDFESECGQDEISFSSKATGTDSVATYYWDMGDNQTYNDSINFDHEYAVNGTYPVIHIVSDTNNCLDTVTQSVQKLDGILADFGTTLDSVACSPFVEFQNNSLGGNLATFIFQLGDTSFYNSGTASTSFDFAGTGTYPVTLIIADSNAACDPDTITKNIVVVTKDTISFSYIQRCNSDSLYLVGNAVPSSVDIRWEWDNGAGGTGNQNQFVTTYPIHGFYDIELIGTDTVTGCSDTARESNFEYYRAINDSFFVDETRSDFACDLEIKIQDRSSGAKTHSWDFGFSGAGSTSTAKSPDVTYPGVGQYVTTLTIAHDSCSLTDTMSIYIYGAPEASFDFDVTQLCDEPRLTFSLDGKQAVNFNGDSVAVSPNWSYNGSGGLVYAAPLHITDYSPVGYIDSVVLVADAVMNANRDHLCSDRTVAYNVPWAIPTEADFEADWQLETMGQDTLAHCGLTITYNDASASRNSLVWVFGDGNSNTDDVEDALTTYAQPGYYEVSQIATNIYTGCIDTATKIVAIADNPKANFDYDTYCEDFTWRLVDLSKAGLGEIETRKFDFGNGIDTAFFMWSTQLDTPFVYGLSDTFNKAYDITLVAVDEFGCSDTLTETYDYFFIPAPFYTVGAYNVEEERDYSAEELAAGVNIYEGDYVTATLIDPDTTVKNFTWDFGDESMTDSENKEVKHHYNMTGAYVLTLTAEGEGSVCEGTIETNINVTHRDLIQMPQAFSPNGDGENDLLHFRALGLKNFRITIYNRWGGVVYTTNDPLSEPWDGKTLSTTKDAPAGVYMWVIEAEDVDETEAVDGGTGVTDQMFGEVILVR